MDDIEPTGRDDAERIVAEAVVALSEAGEWKEAPPGLWARISLILDSMDAALADGDFAALDAAVAELELASPDRVIKVGDRSWQPVPPTIRERMNHLVHRLDVSIAPVDEPEAGEGSRSVRSEPRGTRPGDRLDP